MVRTNVHYRSVRRYVIVRRRRGLASSPDTSPLLLATKEKSMHTENHNLTDCTSLPITFVVAFVVERISPDFEVYVAPVLVEKYVAPVVEMFLQIFRFISRQALWGNTILQRQPWAISVCCVFRNSSCLGMHSPEFFWKKKVAPAFFVEYVAPSTAGHAM